MKVIICTSLVIALLKSVFVALPVSAKLGDSRHLEALQKKEKPSGSFPLKKKKDSAPSPDMVGTQGKVTPVLSPLLKKWKDNLKTEGRDSSDGRIVGGQQVAGPGVYAFYVSWDGSCGGSLIHSDIVLTAAHCHGIPSDSVTVNAYELFNSDTAGAEVLNIVDRAIHPGYNGFNPSNDFMVLKLSGPASHQPIEINSDPSIPATGQDLKVIGLGTTSEGGDLANFLQEVTVTTVSDQDCNDAYEGEIAEDVMFCAGVEGGGKDSCQGDSGGPIFAMTASGGVGKQVGVVSWGYGCARPGLPGVYAEISAVEDWIFGQICALSDDKPNGCPDPTLPPTPTPPRPDEAAVIVSIVTDEYPSEVGWEILDDTNDVVEHVSPGTYFIPNRYETQVNLKKEKTYTFSIFDDYCDGLCCVYGEGSYEVTTGSVVLASGREYGCSETTEFLVPGDEIVTGNIEDKVLYLSDAIGPESQMPCAQAVPNSIEVNVADCSTNPPGTIWTLDNSGLLHNVYGGCLQAGFGQVLQDGTWMRIQPCNSAEPLQKFTFQDSDGDGNPSGKLKLQSNNEFCVTHATNDVNIGNNHLIMKQCQVLPKRRWNWSFSYSVYDYLMAQGGAATSAEGINIQLADVYFGDSTNEHPSASWHIDDIGMVHNGYGECLQAGHGELLVDGTHLRVYPCDEHNRLQKFHIEDDNGLFKLQSNDDLCITVANGMPILIMKTCPTNNQGCDGRFCWVFA